MLRPAASGRGDSGGRTGSSLIRCKSSWRTLELSCTDAGVLVCSFQIIKHIEQTRLRKSVFNSQTFVIYFYVRVVRRI